MALKDIISARISMANDRVLEDRGVEITINNVTLSGVFNDVEAWSGEDTARGGGQRNEFRGSITVDNATYQGAIATRKSRGRADGARVKITESGHALEGLTSKVMATRAGQGTRLVLFCGEQLG